MLELLSWKYTMRSGNGPEHGKQVLYIVQTMKYFVQENSNSFVSKREESRVSMIDRDSMVLYCTYKQWVTVTVTIRT